MFALMPCVCITYLAAIVQCIYVMCILMSELLPIAAFEAKCMSMTVGGSVQPSSRVEAMVSEHLLGCGTEKLQKGQLNNVDRDTI